MENRPVHWTAVIEEQAMQETTLIRRRSEMPRSPLPNCHDGQGALDWTVVLDGQQTRGRQLHFIHDDILPPGASIGVHRHDTDEEYYFILSGTGVMTLDGIAYDVGPGDITAIFPGGEHGLKNYSEEDLRVIVIGLR
jgi:mannose-6-phosphate isomerase-like protein (cupin superfamily)